MNWLLLTLLAAVAESQVVVRRGRSFVGVDPSALTPAGDFKPATTDAYDLGETTTPLRWRYANLSRGVVITHSATTSGVRSAFVFTGAADTGRTASTAQPDVLINGARTVTWATGALTAQSMVEIRPQTMAFVGASTVTHAATVDILDAPTAGTNATFTNSYALRVRAGRAHFGGTVTTASSLAVGGAFGCNGTSPPAQPSTIAEISVAGAAALDGSDTVGKAALLARIQALETAVNALTAMARGNGLVAAS